MYAEQCPYLYLRNRNSYKLPDIMQKSDETLLKNHVTLKYKYPLKINSSELAQYSHSLSPTPSLPAFSAPCNQTRHFSSLASHYNVQESPAFTVKGSTAPKILLRHHKPKWHRFLSVPGFILPCSIQEQVQWSHTGPFHCLMHSSAAAGISEKFQVVQTLSSFFSKAVKINCHQLSKSLRAGYCRQTLCNNRNGEMR